MDDEYPRVVTLTYRIVSDPIHDYAKEAAFDGELRDFRVRLRHRDAVFYPLTHFAAEQAARDALDPQLRAWELDVALAYGTGTMSFKFLSAHVQQNAPQPGVVEAAAVGTISITGRAMLTALHNKHPEPPKSFAVDDFVHTLGELFLLARGTPQTLLYIAYSMKTCVEESLGGLEDASKVLGISKGVFDHVGKLANTRGVGAEVRKFRTGVHRKPLSQAERDWLMQILELMVRRAGAAKAGASVHEQITLTTNPAPEPR